MSAWSHSAWLCVGRIEDLPSPGSWLRAPLTRAGVLVTRGDDDLLRAFHAVCTHRGSALFDLSAPDHGSNATRFTCPYHNFEFELDGRACAQVPDLATVRVDTALGFVFVNLDKDAPPLADALGETPPWFGAARADLEHAQLKRAHRVAYDIAARWTIVVENFQESLHFASVHPALEALTPSALAETWMPSTGGAGPWLGGIMPIVATAETVSTSGLRNGRPFLVPEEDRRIVHDAMRFPNLLTSLQPDYLLTFVLYPLGAGRTRVVASTYVHEDAPESAIDDVTAFWARVHEEDRIACERQERGMSSHPIVAQYTDVEEGAAAVAKLVTPDQLVRPAGGGAGAKLAGIFGKPYADLSELIDTSCFDELHREITRGLALAPTTYTGGTLKWMGVCAPWVPREPHRDAMDAIRAMSKEELAELVALGNDDQRANDEASASDLDPRDPALTFGDETDRPFTRAQTLFLEQRHGVYFPWKACYHLLENDRWDDKHSGDGKSFSDEARALFPKTVAFVESLPFVEIGRVVIFGLLANDHAPPHRDSEPGKALAIAQSISFEPSRSAGSPDAAGAGRHKRFYLSAPDGSSETAVDAPIYWFNDMDWHGVHADPWFRYSVRVDGVFEPAFLERIRRKMRRP